VYLDKTLNLCSDNNEYVLFCFFKVSQSKRLKSDIATLEYDLAALKKVGAQQRNDLKSIGNLIMSELKSLREKALEHEESLNKECKISAKFTTELPVMVTSIKVVGSGLTDLRRELTAMKANSTSQLENMEAAVTNLHQNTYEMTTQMSNLEAEHANLRLALHT
jgi:chromosome segregation ATPase